MTHRMFLRPQAAALIAFALTGCSSLLHSDAPTVQIYTLRAQVASSNAAEARAAMNASLRVTHPLAGPGLGTPEIMLLQSNHRMNAYAASAWAATTPALVESLATQTLRAVGEWSSVQAADSPFPADYLLQISIRRFDADYPASDGAPPTVQVTLDCTLGTEDARTVAASFVARGSAAASANQLSAVVAAFQQATDQALASMAQQTLAAAQNRLTRRSDLSHP